MLKDGLQPKGRVELFTTCGRPRIIRGAPIVRTGFLAELEKQGRIRPMYQSADIDFSNTQMVDHQDLRNIIVNVGKDKVIESLTTGFIHTIARMAIGDRGTLPSDSTIAKVPTPDMTTLYNETYRDDIDTITLNVGTPTVHEVRFIKTFSALDVPITSFSNQANPVVNEIGLITCDLLGGNPLPRPPVAAPNANDADERLFAIRTFKTVPFEAANEISVTIRYTIFIE